VAAVTPDETGLRCSRTTLNVNGSGDAYQSCGSDQPMQAAARIVAAIPTG
jgi:hypothetical protein